MAESKIVALEVTNFMSIKSARVEFDETNIINLCGYNDSGKSAITRLLEIMFYNAYSADQAKFITDGEDYWKGSLHFSDGVIIDRYKYADGKSMWEMYKGTQKLFTNRLDNGGLAAMSENPEIIANYLGVIQDEFTEEKLNVRRNTDKLFLINTTGGDNYKILNSVLQSDVLAEASRQLNEDKNKLNGEVVNLKTTSEVLSNQLNEFVVAPEEVIADTKEQIESLTETTSQLARLTMVAETKKQLDSMVVYDEVESIDLDALRTLQGIISLRGVVLTPIFDEVESVDTKRLETLRQIAGLKKSLFIPIYDNLETVNVDRFKDVKEIGNLYNTLYNANLNLAQVEQELEKTKKELAALSAQYNLKVCKNCGSVVD